MQQSQLVKRFKILRFSDEVLDLIAEKVFQDLAQYVDDDDDGCDDDLSDQRSRK